MSNKGIIGEVSRTVKKCVAEVEWRIKDFSLLSDKDDAFYASRVFSLGGTVWSFFIFPNGASSWNSYGFIQLGFVKVSSHPSPDPLHFSGSLRHVKGHKECKEKCSRNFTELFDCHVFPPLISKLELLRRRREFLPSDVLTVVLTLNSGSSATSASVTPPTECCHCKWTFDKDNVLSHQRKCAYRPVICPDCLKTVPLQKNDVHECQNETTSAECCHCKEKFNNESIASHQKSCMLRSIQCPGCFNDMLLREWLDSHECPNKRTEDDESLCRDFKKVLVDGSHHDLTLKVGDRELRAHRDVLKARSPVFYSMLTHDMVEKKSDSIPVPDCDPNAMEQFLFYIYSGKVETLDKNNMLRLYYVADKYQVDGLKEKCSDFIKNSLSETDICDVIQLAVDHSDSSLLESAKEYFTNNMLGIMQTVEWQRFLKDNSTIANELLLKSVGKLNDEVKRLKSST